MLQDVSLLDWVYEWFHRPSSIDTPQKDRIYVFHAVTLLIGKSIIYHTISRDDLKTVHEYLTYLLLGWHPITEWPKASTYDQGDEVDRWEMCKNSMRNLLDFSRSTVNYFPLLTVLDAASHRTTTPSGFVYGEQVTSMILALWLLKKTNLSIDGDLSAIRACQDLYHRSKRIAAKNVDHEYAGIGDDLRYESWIVYQMNRLLKLNVGTEEFLSTLAYLGWFASFIKAYRSLKLCSRSEKWIDEMSTVLSGVVEHHQHVLRDSELNCNMRSRQEGSDLTGTSRLFSIFRINPPPVKEKFRIIRDKRDK